MLAPMASSPSPPDRPPYKRCQRSADLALHRPLVQQIARRIRGRLPANVGMDELEQAGLVGLNEALSVSYTHLTLPTKRIV